MRIPGLSAAGCGADNFSMIKGILSLFTSGAIFNPMILLGIALGIFSMAVLTDVEIKKLFTDYHLYILVLLLSAGYVFFLKPVYKDGGKAPDYAAMIWATVLGVLKFTMSALLAMSFVFMLSF